MQSGATGLVTGKRAMRVLENRVDLPLEAGPVVPDVRRHGHDLGAWPWRTSSALTMLFLTQT